MLVQLDTPPVVPKLARATIFLAFFGNGFLATCWVVHIPRIRSLLGLSDGELGLILWAATFGLFLGTTLGGWIVERYRSQFVTGIALICLGVATMLAVVSANRLALVLSLVPFGFCNGLIDVSMNSQAAAFEQRTKRWATGSLRCRHRSRRGGIGACLPGGTIWFPSLASAWWAWDWRTAFRLSFRPRLGRAMRAWAGQSPRWPQPVISAFSPGRPSLGQLLN
jgi:MFS family permease